MKLSIHISSENKLKLKQLFIIVVYWVIMVRISIVQDFFGFYRVIDIDATKFNIALRESLMVATGSGLAIGLLTGIVELFVFPKWFRYKKFIILTLYKLVIYFSCILLVAIVTIAFYKVINTDLGFQGILSSIYENLFSNGFHTILTTGMMLSIGINLLLVMQNKIGLANFFPMLIGRYHKPREENRIFLFLDLKSSTYYAEQLGHAKYSLLIQSCFRDLSDLVPNYNGEIYQFVGDEAVITWKTRKKDSYINSLLLFNKFQEVIEKKVAFYEYEFGVTPEFKAAISSGEVMVAEVGGFQKSEIAYHGDVLNIASRLLELSKTLHTDLLISDSVYQNVQEMGCIFDIENMGENKLRGKDIKLVVYSVDFKNGS